MGMRLGGQMDGRKGNGLEGDNVGEKVGIQANLRYDMET